MRISQNQLAAALDAIAETIGKADSAFDVYSRTGEDDWAEAEAKWNTEFAYAQLRVLCETLELPSLHQEVVNGLKDATAKGILSVSMSPDGEPYLDAVSSARMIRHAIQAIYATESDKTVTKDLVAILRGATYSITDPRVFGSLPANEAMVHDRIEAVLRCMFPDLMHKPRLAKQIKNFEPDTGIPSIRTLIEYKYIGKSSEVPAIGDQILADTRGYTSKDWGSFLYVIYETERFRPEVQWRQFLRQCDVPDDTSLIVITGTPTSSDPVKKKIARKSK